MFSVETLKEVNGKQTRVSLSKYKTQEEAQQAQFVLKNLMRYHGFVPCDKICAERKNFKKKKWELKYSSVKLINN